MPCDGLFDKKPIRVCLKWDCAEIKYLNETYDLDATIVMIDEIGEIKDAVFYNELNSKCGSIIHSGDNKDGKNDGYDEIITIDLPEMDIQINYLAIVVNNYSEGGFKGVNGAKLLILGENDQVYHQLDISKLKDAGA